MAKFNQAPPITNDPSYMGYSKEIDRPQNYKTPNRGMQTLFEGIGDALDLGVHTLDTANKIDIENQLYSGVDKIRSEMGVDVATNKAEQGLSLFDGQGKQVPPGATNAQDEIQRLTTAFQNGQLNDSYYWGRVNALTKQVRTQYPGYRSEIDATISSIVGTNPANALRSSIQNEYEASVRAQQSRASSFETFERNNLEDLPPDYLDRKANGNPYSEVETMKYVQQRKSTRENIKDEKAALELKASKNNLTEEEAQGTATFHSQRLVSDIIGQATTALGDNITAKLREGKPLSEQEITAVRAQAGKLMIQAETAVNQMLNTPFVEGGQRSFASVIKDGTKLKDIRENALGQIKSTIDLITNGQYGLANMNANMAKAMQDSDMAKLMRDSDAARKIKLAQELTGSALNVYLNQNQSQLAEAAQAISNLNLSESLTGSATNMSEQLNRHRNPTTKKVDPAAANKLINDVAGVLTNKDFNVEAKINMAKTAFGDDNVKFLDQFADKKAVFMRMVSPEVTKAMIQLKATSPESFDNYAKWTTNGFRAIFKQEANTVQNFITGNENGTIRFDPASNQFIVSVAPDYAQKLVGAAKMPNSFVPGAGLSSEKAFDLNFPGLRSSVTTINQMLKTIEPIMIEQTGGKPSEALVKMITDIDPSSPKEQGLMQMLWEGIKNAVVPGANASEAKDKQGSLNDGGMIQLAAYSADEVQGAVNDDLVSIEEDGADLVSLQETWRTMASGDEAPLLNLIGGAEAPRGYNQIYGKNREAPLDQMTVAEVLQLQDNMVSRGSPSSAVGRYQFINKTLRGLVKGLGINPSEKFTPELQDQLARVLLERRGYNKWKSGTMSDEDFQNSLAQEWAGLPTTSGRSYYAGDGLNAATVNSKAIREAFKQLRA